MMVWRHAVWTLAVVGLAGCGAASPSESVGSELSPLVGANALDTTFGHGGLVTVSGSKLTATTENDLVIQPDGKIVIGTSASDPVLMAEFAIVRLLPSGALDTSFGVQGVATTPYPGPSSQGTTPSIALQADGKIVATNGILSPAAGGDNHLFAVARFNANGAVDTAFGKSGVATAVLPGLSFAMAAVLLVQPDAKILVGGAWRAGIRSATTGALVRFNANGSLDGTFGSGGIVASTTLGEITALALQPDQSILVSASGTVARFSATGASLPAAVVGTLSPIKAHGPTTFTPDGHVLSSVTAPGLGREGRVAALDEFTVTGGVVFAGPSYNLGTAGVFNAESGASALALTPGGKVLAGGIAQVCPTAQACLVTQTTDMFGVAALLPSGSPPGSLETSYGAGGIAQTQFGLTPSSPDDSFITALAVQPADGKVVALGFVNGAAVGLARYKAP